MVIHFLKQVQSLNQNPEVDFLLYGRHLVKSIWRHNPATDRLIMTKFGRQKQNHMRRTKHRSRSKSEVKFQYGGSPFSESGSSFISAVDWDISSNNIIRTAYYIRGLELIKLIFAVLDVSLTMGLIHVVIKQKVFTALHRMQTRYCDENSVRPSVCLSHACIVTKR